MRIEATLPEQRGQAAVELAELLHLSRSQLIDEALSLFTKAVLEVRRGRRIVSVEPGREGAACELATPSLTALEWTSHSARVELSAEAMEQIEALNKTAPAPTESLRRAAKEALDVRAAERKSPNK